MLLPDLIGPFIRPLNELGLAYFVTGSTAGMLFGEPRMTHDVDIVVALPVASVANFVAAFPEENFYVPPLDVLMIEVRRGRRGHCNLISHATGFKADIYFASDALHQWAMQQRKQFVLDGLTLWVAPPEYVILRKLEYFREGDSAKHVRDIRSMLAVSGTLVDRDMISERAAEMGLTKQWKYVLENDAVAT